jgi:hypothetical protein
VSRKFTEVVIAFEKSNQTSEEKREDDESEDQHPQAPEATPKTYRPV